MSQSPNLLNDDGSTSMATMLMMSHHALRRDVARFIRAVEQIKSGDISRADMVREEWEKSYRFALHGHHTMEDGKIFPDIRIKHPDLASALDQLSQQHHAIGPILERGDIAFADLAHPEASTEVLRELKTLLDEHLSFEESQITPALRTAKEFPIPEDEAIATMYAEGFSWSMQGIAPEVIEQVEKLLPEILISKLPKARAAFETRSKRVWGEHSVSASTTPIPTVY